MPPRERLCDLLLHECVDPRIEQVVGALLDLGLERRERVLLAVDRQLEQPLVLDVLQLRLAEVEDAGALRQVVPDQRARRLREEDLAAVARRADPSRADDIEPEVPLLADRGLTGVQPHPHPHGGAVGPLVCLERALGRDGGANGIAGASERVEERVALRVDLRAAVRGERLADDPPVIARHVGVRVPELLEQPGRALDVGEHEGDGSGRQRRHGAIVTMPTRWGGSANVG